MGAYQIHLYPELETAVLSGVLTQQEAWLLMDELLTQESEVVLFPMEYGPLLARLEFSQMDKPQGWVMQ